MKRTLAMLLAVLMLFSFAACAGKNNGANNGGNTAATEPTETEATEPEKTVINVYAFTDEVPKMLDKYVADNNLGDKYELNTTIIATTDGLYQPALDQALAENAVDLYAAEAAFVLKYAQGDAAEYAASYEDLGIDVSKIDSAKIAPYTVDIGTRPADGKVVGLAYQSTGGCFIYRDSVAKQVWGEDADAALVSEKIGGGSGNWDAFMAAAEECGKAGVAICSGDGDVWHAVENSSSQPWIVDGKLTISPEREAFFEMSKTLKDKGYCNKTTDWQDAWFADMKGEGEKPVLGFFGPAWLINYTLAPNCGGSAVGEGTYGDWRVCESPIGFLWGGTWIFGGQSALEDDAKKEFVAGVIDWITLDDSETGLQYQWANGTSGLSEAKDSVASGTVMAKSNGELDFLGGQNMFDGFVPANDAANGRVLTQYDETINGFFRDAVNQYGEGNFKTVEEAIEAFKGQVADNLDVTVE